MSILTHRFEEDGTLNFIVTSPHHKHKETMKVRQLLAAQPTNPQAPLQVYHYLHESSTSTRSMETPVPPKLETMLLDYVEAGHMDPIQQVVDMCLSSGYYPTETIVLVLMDSLLKRTKNKNKQQRKEKVQQLYKSHALLLQTLELFGPRILTPLWTRLGANRTGKKRLRRHSHNDRNQDQYDDDDDENEFEHGMRLSRFDDFWDLVNYCFRQPTNKLSLNALGCRLAMDVLINLLSKDIRSRKDRMDSMSKCLLLSSIPPNPYGVRSNFNRCLDILFSGINSSSSLLQAQNTEQAMALLNQLILLSYCGQHLLETEILVDQTYQRIVRLETSTMQHVIQSIQFPAFIASLCDIYFDNTDYSHVAAEHLVYRSRQAFSVSKMKNYFMKTRPNHKTMTVPHVWRHCLMVMWRWNVYLGMFSYRYDGATTQVETTRKRADEEGITMDDLMQWKQRLLHLARLCNDNTDELTTDINDIIEMMMLSLDS